MRLRIVDRHLLLELDDAGRLALVDTGSPFDIGRGRAAMLLDEKWAPPSTHAAVLDAASAHLGLTVEWLIGAPTLSRCRALLDWRGGRAALGAVVIDVDASPLPIALPSGDVPTIEIGLDGGETARAVLDSGAALSYAPRAAVAGRAPIRRERDFHPLIGPFETDVFALPITVGARAIALEAGVLPPALERALATAGGWIVGSDFFCDRTIVLDYPALTVWDGEGRPPS